MNFNDPKVRSAMVAHINFAVASVNAALQELSLPSETDGAETRALKEMTSQLRNPIIMQILGFTLNLDYQLKNSLVPAGTGVNTTLG